jgi:hypothetical protein
MQSENEIYGMWKIYNCKPVFCVLSAFSLMENSAVRHTWRVRYINPDKLQIYLPIAHISNPKLLLLLLKKGKTFPVEVYGAERILGG